LGSTPKQCRAQIGSNPFGRAVADRIRELDTERAHEFALMVCDGLPNLTDPDAQIKAFYGAVMDGMPAVEAADYFLHMDAEQYAAACESSPMFCLVTKRAEASVAREQYLKVTHGSPREALEWLRANRSEQWKPKADVKLTLAEAFKEIVKDPSLTANLSDEELKALAEEDDEP